MITIGWIWLVLAALSSLGNVVYAAKGGASKTAGVCAFDAVMQALLAAWIYVAIIYT